MTPVGRTPARDVAGKKMRLRRVFCVLETGIILNLATELESGQYTVVLRVSDNQDLGQVSTIQATVCDCTGEQVRCKDRVAAATNLPLILGILAAILVLLSKSGGGCRELAGTEALELLETNRLLCVQCSCCCCCCLQGEGEEKRRSLCCRTPTSETTSSTTTKREVVKTIRYGLLTGWGRQPAGWAHTNDLDLSLWNRPPGLRPERPPPWSGQPA